MRILLITPYLPTQIRVRPYNFIKALSNLGHDIYLISLIQKKGEASDIEDYCERVEKFCLSKYRSYLNCLLSLPSSVALQAAYCFCKRMRNRVKELLDMERFDVIHVEHIRGSHFVSDERKINAVFDAVDCITALYKQFSKDKPSLVTKFISGVEYLKLRRYELHEARRFDKVIVTSDMDKEELQRLDKRINIEVLTNGVDLEYFRPTGIENEPNSIILSGKMSYYANESAAVFFCREILPLVKKKIPKVKLYIVGNNPSSKVKYFDDGLEIVVTGYVPDIRTYMVRAKVAVAPTTVGAGVQNKVIEAMACGKPVVATSRACQALSVVSGKHLLIADGPEDFAEAVVRLLRDGDLADTLAREARKYVEEHHCWEDKAKQLEGIYTNLIP